ncbi:DUF4280 domain-containing protein [Thermomonas aquatica]|jgi:hypothetical protein|uniref:DUF4280 domain-containing protein n=1 Tax=Thermomonas aquatica TaxID=2202149 RepID=A0A5B7ZP08_9GAMM|nr:DUF4280 domain-containing protein [Thermomonas aquatica]QDA56273.1 DUF4280 domain-containing protein [Thermomonas aquatica]
MPIQVVNGAMLMCSFGVAPSSLVVLPTNMVLSGNQPAANILDHQPMVNIQPFGMCITPSNPQVAAATAAASGVLTPQPCIPMTQTPWMPGVPNLLIGNMPAVDNTCTCMCLWGGVVSVTSPGQFTELIP